MDIEGSWRGINHLCLVRSNPVQLRESLCTYVPCETCDFILLIYHLLRLLKKKKKKNLYLIPSFLANVGLNLSELKKVLNPNYDWEAAIQAVINEPLDKV